jgi:hypothetical protein
MLRAIVVHVAALAEGGEVLRPVVGRVMIAVPGRENHARGSHTPENIIRPDRQTDEASGSITPGARLSIPPATVPEMKDALSMRTQTDLAAPLSPLKADHSRELAPIDGVEEAVLAPDRHPGQS